MITRWTKISKRSEVDSFIALRPAACCNFSQSRLEDGDIAREEAAAAPSGDETTSNVHVLTIGSHQAIVIEQPSSDFCCNLAHL